MQNEYSHRLHDNCKPFTPWSCISPVEYLYMMQHNCIISLNRMAVLLIYYNLHSGEYRGRDRYYWSILTARD